MTHTKETLNQANSVDPNSSEFMEQVQKTTAQAQITKAASFKYKSIDDFAEMVMFSDSHSLIATALKANRDRGMYQGIKNSPEKNPLQWINNMINRLESGYYLKSNSRRKLLIKELKNVAI